jgi:hypothetical protein
MRCFKISSRYARLTDLAAEVKNLQRHAVHLLTACAQRNGRNATYNPVAHRLPFSSRETPQPAPALSVPPPSPSLSLLPAVRQPWLSHSRHSAYSYARGRSPYTPQCPGRLPLGLRPVLRRLGEISSTSCLMPE